MPDLSKEEVERRLEELNSRAWPEGQLQVLELMSGQYQDLLQTALSLYDRAEAAEQERDGWKEHAALSAADALDAELARDRAIKARDAFRAEALALRTLVDVATPIDQPPVDLAPLTAAAAERWAAMEAVCEAALADRSALVPANAWLTLEDATVKQMAYQGHNADGSTWMVLPTVSAEWINNLDAALHALKEAPDA